MKCPNCKYETSTDNNVFDRDWEKEPPFKIGYVDLKKDDVIETYEESLYIIICPKCRNIFTEVE